jgi:hypothetical protein
MTIPQICVQAKGPLAVTAHEAGCGLSKSHDRVRVFVRVVTELKTFHIYEAVLRTI